MDWFMVYLVIYSLLMVTYIWYRYFLLFAKHRSYDDRSSYPVSVVIPFYNEKPESLYETIRSVHCANGEKQIILVNDGSTNSMLIEDLHKMQELYGFTLISYKKNRGKRYAQCKAFKKAKYDIIVTVDSDTIVDKNAFVNLVKPFNDEIVGCTTGNVLLSNTKRNLLTRIIDVSYRISNNVNKQGMGNFGSVICCSGCLSAYRKHLLIELSDRYLNQQFLGKLCTYGDDRHLTNLILEKGYDAIYVDNALCYTETPATVKSYVRQQIRWKRSFWRESMYAIKNVKNSLVRTEVSYNMIMILMSIGIRISLLIALFYAAITGNWFYFVYTTIMIAVFSIFRNFTVIKLNPLTLLYTVLMAIFYDFVLYWLNFYALLTLDDGNWMTR